MRFLADENVDFAVVRGLRSAGHDVRALAEETTRTVDAEVIALSSRERRILLTEDKDFGWLAFVAGAGGEGVILIRFPGNATPDTWSAPGRPRSPRRGARWCRRRTSALPTLREVPDPGVVLVHRVVNRVAIADVHQGLAPAPGGER